MSDVEGSKIKTRQADRFDPEMWQAWKDLFQQEAPHAAEAQFDAVLEILGDDAATLRALIAADNVYPDAKTGWTKHGMSVDAVVPPYPVEVWVRVPAGYTPDKPWPLLIACHGQGIDGRIIGDMLAPLLDDKLEQYLIVAPTLPEEASKRTPTMQEHEYLAALAWARQRYNVDDDRVYLSGYSLGGHATWHIATMHPRLFAAAVSMAGVPLFDGGRFTSGSYLENLRNLPFWALWGEKDEAVPGRGIVNACREAQRRIEKLRLTLWRGTEIPGMGHMGCTPEPAEFIAFLEAHRRVLAPDSFSHSFHDRKHSRGYFLDAVALAGAPLDLTRKLRVPITPAAARNAQLRDQIIQKYIDDHMYQYKCDVDPSANRMRIRIEKITAMRAYLHEGLFDYDQPVTVEIAEHTWQGRAPISVKCMLKNYTATRDQTCLIVNEIVIGANGRARVLYGK